jgi:hypothetical protein
LRAVGAGETSIEQRIKLHTQAIHQHLPYPLVN